MYKAPRYVLKPLNLDKIRFCLYLWCKDLKSWETGFKLSYFRKFVQDWIFINPWKKVSVKIATMQKLLELNISSIASCSCLHVRPWIQKDCKPYCVSITHNTCQAMIKDDKKEWRATPSILLASSNAIYSGAQPSHPIILQLAGLIWTSVNCPYLPVSTLTFVFHPQIHTPDQHAHHCHL